MKSFLEGSWPGKTPQAAAAGSARAAGGRLFRSAETSETSEQEQAKQGRAEQSRAEHRKAVVQMQCSIESTQKLRGAQKVDQIGIHTASDPNIDGRLIFWRESGRGTQIVRTKFVWTSSSCKERATDLTLRRASERPSSVRASLTQLGDTASIRTPHSQADARSRLL